MSRKRVKAHGLRVGTWAKRYQDKSDTWHAIAIEGALLVPMRDAAGTLWNLQAIFPKPHSILGRDKDFLPGGRKVGLFHVLGEPADAILIAEGYATAATVHEATWHQTCVAFDCSNLMAVAHTVRDGHPGQRITLCADNDRHTSGNPGVTKANAAARAIGGLVSVPTFPDGVPGTDWNDLHVYSLECKEVSHGN
ncbi:MAG: toprim protein [Proteobacteria bacterium]|nr:toprim protein [Pseudomonadota bacterium]